MPVHFRMFHNFVRSAKPVRFVGLLWVLLSALAWGQDIAYKFQRWEAHDGLPHNVVFAGVEGPDGFVWFGTQSGLVRFDGYAFRTFKHDPDDPTSLPSNKVSFLLVDRDRQIWIGTWGEGLAKFDPIKETFERFVPKKPDPLMGHSVQSLYQDRDGMIWMGTFKSGFTRINPKTRETVTYRSSSPEPYTGFQDRVWSFTQDVKGSIWLATSKGLGVINAGQEQVELVSTKHLFTRPEEPLSFSLYQDRHGYLWAGTYDGLIRIDPLERKFTLIQDQSDTNLATVRNSYRWVTGDKNGMLWLTTTGNGLKRYDPVSGEFVHFRHDPDNLGSIGHNRTEVAFVDNSQGLWVTTMGGGVNRLDLKAPPIHLYRPGVSGFENGNISAFAEDAEGRVWYGTFGNGIGCWDPSLGRFLTAEVEPVLGLTLTDPKVASLFVDDQQWLWVGNHDVGADVIDLNTAELRAVNVKPEGHERLPRPVHHMMQDDNGWVWLSDESALAVVKDDSLQVTIVPVEVLHEEAERFNPIFCTFQDFTGRHWVGTRFGLYRYQDGQARYYPIDLADHEKGDDLKIFAIDQTQKDLLWLGTQNGLASVKVGNKQMKYIDEPELVNLFVEGLIADRGGYLWLSTNAAIYRYDPINREVLRFDARDGLQGNILNGQAFFEADNGFIYSGGPSGFNHFNPALMSRSEINPPVRLTAFKVFNQEMVLPEVVHATNEIEIPYSDNMFSFEYATLSFSGLNQNHYAYMLEGFDDTWREVGSQRVATYTNLNPGSYVFRVAGSARDSGIRRNEDSVRLVIVPPFYMRTWFYVLVTVVVLLLLASWQLYQHRIRVYLEREVNERTASLVEANRELERTAQSLRDTQQQLLQAARQAGMAEIASEVLHNVGNVLNSLSVSAGTLEQRLGEVRSDFLAKVIAMLRENEHRLNEFFTEDRRGKLMLEGLERFKEQLAHTEDVSKIEIKALQEHVLEIGNVLSYQREFAQGRDTQEAVELAAIIENVVNLHAPTIEGHGVQIELEFQVRGQVNASKFKLVNVFHQIVKNAIESVSMNTDRKNRQISITVTEDEDQVRVEVRDNGTGLEDIEKKNIFAQGFSTKEGHGGFGLHYCANTVQEMGGSIGIKSGGRNQGAVFVVKLPALPTRSLLHA